MPARTNLVLVYECPSCKVRFKAARTYTRIDALEGDTELCKHLALRRPIYVELHLSPATGIPLVSLKQAFDEFTL